MTAARSDASACQQIVRRIACHEFPWDVTRSLEMALFRTFASPRIGGLLHATGEFVKRAQLRYDDTDLLVSVLLEEGFDSPAGRRAIRRINELHGRFSIRNEDYLYVLSTFILEPIRWIDRFGWRPLRADERAAWVAFWREVGARMGIREAPSDLLAFEQLSRDYEDRELRCTEGTRAVGAATCELFASWFPPPLRPLVRRSIHAFVDEPLRASLGFPRPSRLLGVLVRIALRTRGLALRLVPTRRRPRLRTRIPRPSRAGGWTIETLGPPGESISASSPRAL